MTDRQLLDNYLQGSPDALCELVQRHSRMVHAAALREVRDPHLADDITQAVFLVLMRRAKSLGTAVSLPGWLFKTTLYAAADARKQATRRQLHEQEAPPMHTELSPESSIIAQEAAKHLNQAIAALAPKDRDLIVARYLEDQTTAQVAVAAGTTEHFARMRLARALERLRKQFNRRNVLIGTGVLAALLEARPSEAATISETLHQQLRAVALGQSSPSPRSQALAQGVHHMVRMQRARAHILLSSAIAAAVLAVAIPLTLAAPGGTGAPAHAAGPVAPKPIQLAQAEPIPPSVAMPAAPASDTAAVKAAVDAHTAFAVDLYQELNKTQSGENLFISPFSISTIMGLTAAGARGNTLAQMNTVLHVSDPEATHAGVSKISHLLVDKQDGKKPYQLSIANALWEDQTCPFKQDFLTLSQKYYDLASLTTLSFRADPEAARALINKSVEDQTQAKIKELLPPKSITANTALVLTNAIYFKGDWATPFIAVPSAFNRPAGTFYVTPQKTVQTADMQKRGEFAYFENDDVQAASFPYQTAPGIGGDDAERISMVIVLPKKRDGLAALEKTITPEILSKWTTALAPTTIAVTLPKFSITCPTKLTDTLQNMGMVDAFKSAAHLEGIATLPPGYSLYISDVFHKAYINVDEKGTEAAAATAVIGGMGGGRPAPVPLFRADHPFFFFIRFEPTNSILFMGHLVEPPAGSNPQPPMRAAAAARGPARGLAPVPTQPAAGQPLKDPKTAASAALELVTTTRADAAFMRPHVVLAGDMDALETAAKSFLDDPGTDAQITQKLNAALSGAIDQTATLAATIANRTTETAENQQKSRQIAEKLKALQIY